tara:strand:- start:54 stop:1226 length:1173 start_codon:yes stop_codon:yes gene_type:complete
MTMSDVRDLEVPSVVAAIRDTDKLKAFDQMLEESQFWQTLEACRSRSGKSPGDFLVVIKPNFMMAIKIEDPPLVYTDPELVKRWISQLAQAGYTNVRVVEAQNVYGLWYRNRGVNHVARVIGLDGDGFEVHDLTHEQYPFDYGGLLGEHYVGASWRDADFRISFAKNKTHDVSHCTLVIKNTYGCLPAQDKFTEYHQKREVDEVTIEALRHFPVHFAAIDATWSLDGPLGYKEGFDVVRDEEGRVLNSGNIHRTDTLIGGRDLLAVEKVGMLKMGLDPGSDTRFFGLAVAAFGERDFEWIGDTCTYDEWLNIGSATCLQLDIGEEMGVIAHFFGESMAHVDPVLFPPKKTTWIKRLMHTVGRFFFVRKVRSRKGIRVVPKCHGTVDCLAE